ncbi:metal-dependent hydrolase [Candidatus Woesearchaeota archaeon CG_4_10_14_0_2_um_filter_33_10]|nr:MAG: metal-dependent hydrolase [Candidatus Woesearchaeota archaeon CG10_big_fil_rev_8_21_14_0_10_33_12]PIU72235.1 MAG: metal-dependent hydrolase [Candidatus Woesearchaeota archaeon CG06_land_8_20_14_3_00_33_13]PIZ53400.1 MAG: metal-dependent hydrolase [Candidatus Woesearchaeota archaeon CG_4_10_14_0_2_um_filter_33_10]
MRFRTHIIFSFLISLLIINSFNIQNKIIFIVILLIASALPDIDSYKSKVGKKIKPLSFLINIFLGHRGIFHSLFLLILILLFIMLINYEITAAFFIGYLSHLVLDSLTPEGVMFLYPFSKKRIQGFIRTGSLFENILFVLLLALCFCIIV